MNLDQLNKIAVKMVTPGQGLLAADESTGTIKKRFDSIKALVDIIKSHDAIPGIKVDKGAKALATRPGETITEGLDGLRDRLAEYYDLGARFAKWRAVIEISNPETADRVTPKPISYRLWSRKY